VNLQKGASWANIGSFILAVYVIWNGQHQPSANAFVVTPGLGIFIFALSVA
jgi:hypothetical protein